MKEITEMQLQIYSARRRERRSVDEMIGMVHGVLADGKLADEEIHYLAKYLMAKAEFVCEWPFNVLLDRIVEVLEDGVVTEDEREDLHALLEHIIGSPENDAREFEAASTTLPLTKPEPEVIFDRNQFVFTGKFYFGTRKRCHLETLTRGGQVADDVTLSTRYLVVGLQGNDAWLHSSYGRKIKKAVELSQYGQIYVISEKHWEQFLFA